MDRTQFTLQAKRNEVLAAYLDEVAQGATASGHRAAGAGLLIGVAAYALYRLVRNYFDHQKGLQEAELRQLLLQEVDNLVQKGWDKDKALAAVLEVSKAVTALSPDDPVIQAGMTIIKGGQ
ncbi:hypothetical protein [Frigoriglobus tundricola]|uniref:Uncharacterized protein n=1 Tax=Frigoriglobus tundricola TaxID=2774151 RepID=A0A6M5YLL1_9BACT|nr:hypothetical protein [Frigoriglobus tundricola]QJW94805.1 hypothetical protein FTUN_2328 [Frigoriglobus tundricola]